MHQSEQFFIFNDTNNHVRVLSASRRDFFKYAHFTLPSDMGFDMHIPDDYFVVIWPACSDTHLVMQRYCDDDSDWRDYSCTRCEYDEMITLVPDSKFKILLQSTDQNLHSRLEVPRRDPGPASCRILCVHKEALESQQRKIYAAEFIIPQHVIKLDQSIAANLSSVEQEERNKTSNYEHVVASLFENCIVKLLLIYSRQFFGHDSNIVQPARDTLAGRLPELLAYIRNHCHESISVMHLAKLFNVHRCSLSKCFKRHYDMTLYNCLQEHRVDKIIQILSNEDVSIHSISQFFGYKNVSSFSKFFRQKTGSTPTQYRRCLVNLKAEGKRLDNITNSLYDHKIIQE